jgi:hypothetical protein
VQAAGAEQAVGPDQPIPPHCPYSVWLPPLPPAVVVCVLEGAEVVMMCDVELLLGGGGGGGDELPPLEMTTVTTE